MNFFYNFIFFILLFFCYIFASDNFYQKLSEAALSITNENIIYEGSYRKIKYPNGDVPSNIGVCTDVVIRAYRKLSIDLQKNVHEDMVSNFNKYPNKRIWGLKKTDKNIDHRRVPNLVTFFTRFGEKLKVSKNPKNYLPGDIVRWTVGGLDHIGIVIHLKSKDKKRNLIVHNVGSGQVAEDFLFQYPIIGHYRYKSLKNNLKPSLQKNPKTSNKKND